MHAVLTWMTAVLNNQVARLPWPDSDSRVGLTLTGPGGGEWCIDESGLRAPSAGAVAARITAPAITFPDWGTRRSSWRDHDATIAGDSEPRGPSPRQHQCHLTPRWFGAGQRVRAGCESLRPRHRRDRGLPRGRRREPIVPSPCAKHAIADAAIACACSSRRRCPQVAAAHE